MARKEKPSFKVIAGSGVTCQHPGEGVCLAGSGAGGPCLGCVTDTVRNKLIVAHLITTALKNSTIGAMDEADVMISRGLLTEVASAIDAAGQALGMVEAVAEPKPARREEKSLSYIG